MMRRFLLSILIITSLILVACAPVRQPPAPPVVQEVAPEPTPEPTITAPAPTPVPTPAPAPTQPPSTEMTKSFTIEANDARASPNTLSIPQGARYTITFNVDSQGTYYGGLDFRSTKFDSGKVLPGKSWTSPELTADDSFKIGAYWPSAGVHKWDVQVTVS